MFSNSARDAPFVSPRGAVARRLASGVAYPAFLPAVASRPELGWRLARAVWGQGLATEAASAAHYDAFVRLGLRELVSIVHSHNVRCGCVATKLGMTIERKVHNAVLARDIDLWQLDRSAMRAGAAAPYT